eukprot:m.313558 g.313558  ORF g.313558 m.313558 type:complete len:475 (+) comp19664_c0_seq6:4703-6127(+)
MLTSCCVRRAECHRHSSVPLTRRHRCLARATVDPCSLPSVMLFRMAYLNPLLSDKTILDLSLPGTHDTLTFDLSTTVSDGANDLPPDVAWVLHEFHDFVPGHFIRDQAKTQGLNITEQLENGIRFLDFRIMFSAPPAHSAFDHHSWFCLHFVESNRKALSYLGEVRTFLEAHPEEVVVMWFSRHGNTETTGNDQYPGVSQADKLAFWSQVEKLFAGLLFDTRQSSLNTTTMSELLVRNHRAVVFVSDYAEFTNSSSLAIDARQIDNILGDEVTAENATQQQILAELRNAGAHRAADKAQNRFMLMSMAAGPPAGQISKAAELKYWPLEHTKLRKECAALFHIPNMTAWCPPTLQDVSQLINYYNQIALDAVITRDSPATPYDLPNAIYLDAVAEHGTIRTGTEVFMKDSVRGTTNATRGFAYVDTFLLHMAQRECQTRPVTDCSDIITNLQQRRAANPLHRWSDPAHGRLLNWP